MEKVRVVHCLGQLNTGGAETLVVNILRNIDREKYQFDFLLFSPDKGFYDDEVISYGSRLYYTPNSRQGLFKYINSMIDFFKEEKVEIVHAHMDWQCGFIAYAAYKAGVKRIIVHSHAIQEMFDTNSIKHLLININKYLIHKYANVRLACSKEAGESLYNNDKFEVLTNGIDMDRYINPYQTIVNELKNEFKLNDDDIILGHVGGFSTNKNQTFLIDIINELVKENKHYKLILVGTGNTKEDMMNKVKSLDLEDNVIFTGVRKEIPEIMHLFCLFLFPSIYEGLGIVAIEAQASHLNCIVSDTIPKEVDLKMNLVKFVPLIKEQWINEIKVNINKEVLDNKELLLSSEFNIKNTVNFLKEKYKED